MAVTPKASLPKVNKPNQRTKLRPRDLTTVAFVASGSPRTYNGAALTKNAAFSTTGWNKWKLQQFLDSGLIIVAT